MPAAADSTFRIKARAGRSSKSNGLEGQVQRVLDLFDEGAPPSLPLAGDQQEAVLGNLPGANEVKVGRTVFRHHCHWPDCGKEVPPAMWGCRDHWYSLPKELRDLIWRTYQPGQEASKRPSLQYIEAARRVRNWILDQQNTSPKGALDHGKL